MLPTLSVVIPALNEEANLAASVETTLKALRARVSDYEILIVNDGSRDKTGEIADSIAASNSCVRVFHHAEPHNVGGAFKLAIREARFDYLMAVPGDNEASLSVLVPPLEAIGDAEMVIPYVEHDPRGVARVVISKSYVWLLNRILGNNIRYYNGSVIHRVSNLRQITIETDSFAYQSEALVKLLRAGKSYIEVPVTVEETGALRRTKALRLKNIVGVARATARLAWGLRR